MRICTCWYRWHYLRYWRYSPRYIRLCGSPQTPKETKGNAQRYSEVSRELLHFSIDSQLYWMATRIVPAPCMMSCNSHVAWRSWAGLVDVTFPTLAIMAMCASLQHFISRLSTSAFPASAQVLCTLSSFVLTEPIATAPAEMRRRLMVGTEKH